MSDTTNKETVRVGVVGTGFMGRSVGNQFAQEDRVRVVALADLDADARQKAGDKFGVADGDQYPSYEEMLDEADLDAIVIATPHALHYDQIVTAFNRGLHVFCDKPLTTNTEDAADLVERVSENSRVLMVGYQRHLSPAFIKTKERYARNSQEPTHFTAEITQGWNPGSDAWRSDPEMSGGGFLYDTGSHLVDAVLWILDRRPVYVTATMEFEDDNQQFDRRAVLTVELEDGLSGTLTASSRTPIVRENIHFYDAAGGARIEGKGWGPRKLTIIDEENGEYTPLTEAGGHHHNKAEAFLDAVLDGTEPPATAQDALQATLVKEAAYKSARTNQRVPVSRD